MSETEYQMSEENFGGWDQVEIPQSGGKYFKFQDGVITKFVLLGKPVVTSTDFGSGPKTRVRSNMVDLANPTEVVVVEFSAKMANQIKDLFSMSDSGSATILSCKRKGTGIQTEYTLVAGKGLTDDQKAKLGKLDLHDLSDEAQASAPAATDEDEEIPF